MSENEDNIKEVAKKCYEKISSKAIEIILIVLNSLLLVIYIVCFCLINMEVFSGYGLLFFLILAPLFINFIFSIVLRYWRSKDVIKNTRKKIGTNIALTGLIFLAITYGAASIADIVISEDDEEIKKNCYRYQNKNNCPNKYDILVLNITFIITNIISIFLLYAWSNLRERIKSALDEPPSSRNIGTQTTDNPEKEDNIPLEGNAVSIYNKQNILNEINKKNSENKIEVLDSQNLINTK